MIFLLRLMLSVGLAFLIGRFFFTTVTPFKVAALAAVMCALAYLFEYTKNKGRGGRNGG